jgi:broad specificity phosphatase PhoE
MTTFYIARHGQTENNLRKRLSGWIDTPLTEAGVANTVSSAAKLTGTSFDRVVASDLGRAFITAYLIIHELGYDIDIEREPALREVNYGDLSNTSYVGADRHYPELSPEENTNFLPKNGESLAQMQQRVLNWVFEAASASPSETILLVAHDGTINALMSAFSGKDIGVVDAESDNPNDFVARVVVDDDTITAFEPVS